jgi:Resolvase, N terminal domain
MMGVFAEFERAMIRDRVKAGLANARAKGVRTVHRVLNGEHVSQASSPRLATLELSHLPHANQGQAEGHAALLDE